MPSQQATVSELSSLKSSLGELVTYCQALQAGAAAHAYGLPAQWQGPAMAAFLASFANWSALAAGLTAQAQALQERVAAAEGAYEQTIQQLDETWSSFVTSIPEL
ncbi:MAG TPA: hypothetical protein VKZ73_09530 [Microbacterium sp.]|nr:hypothetical protein [Microbacterium sp.]